jgi:hypothetical protein
MLARRIAAAAFGLALAVPVGAFAQDRTQAPDHRHRGVNAREHRQVQRIKDGREDNELTRRELDKLKADEASIRAEERVYRKSGEGLSKWERKDLQKDLNKTSREIYRAKHNNRERK